MYSAIFVIHQNYHLMKFFPLFLSSLALFFILVSCGQKKQNDINNQSGKSATTKLTKSDISKLKFLEYNIDTKTKKVIEKWDRFAELEIIVTDVKNGDLSFFKNNHDTIVSFLKELKLKIPDTINTRSVEARISALETKLYKLENIYSLSTTSKNELILSVKEFLESVSNLNLQMNKKLEKDSRNIDKP